MITFKKLGQYGQLGNQLFQVATALALAARNDDKAVFPMWPYAIYFKQPLWQKPDIVVRRTYQEKYFHYSEIQYKKNLCLEGFFQSELYFKDQEDFIRWSFQPTDEILQQIKDKYGNLLKHKVCSIHVRRGDYLDHPDFHITQPMGYYFQAMELISPKVSKFLVFSDDIEWCKENFTNCHFVEGNTNIFDLIFMSLCDHHIIANSSFSWWGSWLNPNDKIVVAPQNWFGEKVKKKTHDLYCKNWTVI